MGLLKILFIITLLSIPIGEILRFELTIGTSINLSNIAVGVLTAYWLVLHFFKKKKINTVKLIKPITIFAGIGFISLLFNFKLLNFQELVVSFLYLIRWVMYVSIYFIVLEFDKHFQKKIIYLLLSIGGIIVIAGYVQYFFYPSLRNLFYLGWDEHLYRMFSSFLDPNFAGAFLSLYFFLIVGLMSSFTKKSEELKIVLFGVLGILTFIAIFLTYSRSAILMLIVGCLIFLILKRKFSIMIFLALLVVGLLLFVPKAFKTEGTDLFRKVSSEARISSAKQAMSIFLKNPVLGIGFNAYKYARIRHGFTGKNDPSHAEGGADVSFLFVMATTGVIGFIAYLYLLSKIISTAFLKYKNNFIAGVLLVSVISLVINSFFINSLFYSFFMLWMWILLGLTENA